MAETIGMRRIRKTLIIHRIVQIALMALLLYMALHFMQKFETAGNMKPFYNSLIITLLIQVALFFPIRKFTEKEAIREINAAANDTPSVAEAKQLRTQRLIADFIKASVFIFFVVFILTAPPIDFLLGTTYFCCIGTVLSYLQNFNFAVRRRLAGGGTP